MGLVVSGCGFVTTQFRNAFEPDSTKDPVAFLKLDKTSITLTEGSAVVIFTTLSESLKTSAKFTVELEPMDGGSLDRFGPFPLQFSIEPGKRSKTIVIPTDDNDIYDGSSTYHLKLSSSSKDVVIQDSLQIRIEDDEAPPVVTFSSASQNFNESAGTASVTVSLNRRSQFPITLSVGLTSSTATEGSDFTFTSPQTFVVDPLETSLTLSVPITNDSSIEATENILFDLAILFGDATLGTTTGHQINIIDDETPSLSISNATVDEGSSASLTVTLSQSVSNDVSFDWTTIDGTAVEGTHYTSASGTSTITAGDTSVTISVNTLSVAGICDPNRNLIVRLSNPVNAQIGASDGTITVRDVDLPELSVADASGTEGGLVTFVVTVTPTCSTHSVGFSWSTAGGTATSGTDFTAVTTASSTINAGIGTKNISVVSLDDTLDEDSEDFTVTLSSPTQATLGSVSSATGTITDDDNAPTISIANASVTEGTGAGSTNLSFTITASTASGQNITVNYATSDGSALSASDYTDTSGTATITAGSTTTTINVPITRDSLDEANETFTITLSGGANYTVAGSTLSATGTITDDDNAPTISIANASVTEGTGAGSTNLSFTITASTASGQNITVNYATSDGSALSTSDYTDTSGTATITAGSTTTTINVPITRDSLDEANETFTITLSGGANYTVAGSTLSATGTITDDDNAPTISIANASVTEGTGAGSTNLSFTITASTASGQNITVNYATSDGSALSASDYTDTSGTATITAGATTTTVNVPITRDSTVEGDETLTLTLSGGTNYTVAGSTLSATGTITNDDSPTITSVSPGSGSNAGGTTITITGTGFLSGATATVNGISCTSPSVVSSTSFTCNTPSSSSAGAVNVVLTNSAGSQPSGTRSVTLTNGFTYILNSWNLGDPTHFIVDADQFSQSSNQVALTPPDLTIATSGEFSAAGATLSGVRYDGGTSKLTIDTTISSPPTQTSSWTPQWSDVIGYWNLDSNLQDSTLNASNGTAGGTAGVSATSKVGVGALQGDGTTNSRVTFYPVSHLYGVSRMSVAFWIRLVSKSSWSKFIELSNRVTVDLNKAFQFGTNGAADQALIFEIRTSGGSRTVGSDSALATGTWVHVVGTYDGAKVRLFLNGQIQKDVQTLTGSLYSTNGTNDRLSFLGAPRGDYGLVNGIIDDVVFWDEALTIDQVKTLYATQGSNRLGTYTSPVYDLGDVSNLSKLKWKSTLPFFKDLLGDTDDGDTSPNIESSADYSSIAASSENLGTGLQAHYRFNESSWSGAANEVLDSSGAARHCRRYGSAQSAAATMGRAANFTTTSDSLRCGTYDPSTGNITVSAWVFWRGTNGGYQNIVTKADTWNSSDMRWAIYTDSNGVIYWGRANSEISTGIYLEAGWSHIVVQQDASNSYLFVNGKQMFSGSKLTFGTDTAATINIGQGDPTTSEAFNGMIDEVSIYNRAISSAEIVQLYRRGANRVKFQLRTCNDLGCVGETWQGPDNTASSYFSEQHSYASVSATLLGSGFLSPLSPDLDFSKFIAAGLNLISNQYAQYRIDFETDDVAGLCSGIPCLPDVTSVTMVPVFQSSSAFGIAFSSALSAFNISISGTCSSESSVRFQVSSDNGSNYKYWNGSSWTTVTTSGNYAQASSLTTINSNIATLASSGTFRFRALVPSEHGKTCVLSSASLTF